MKRVIYAVAVLTVLLSAAPLFAVTRTIVVVNDVIKMTKAGVSDEAIIAYVKKAPDFEVNGDDVIAMTDANVSRAVIKAVIDESAVRRDEAKNGKSRTTVYVSPRIGPYYYDPYYYPYDPFWYGPRLSIGFGFGGFYGGHFGHGRWGGRGHR